MTWNRPSVDFRPSPKSKKVNWRWIMAGGLFCFAALIVVFFLVPRPKSVADWRKGSGMKPQTMVKQPEVKKYLKATTTAPVPHRADVNMKVAELPKQEKTTFADTGAVERVIGKLRKEPTFDTVTESVLARLFSARLGDPVPMVPTIPARELDKIDEILNRETPLSIDDDDELLEMKKVGDLAKKEFQRFLAQGGKSSDFIEYYSSRLEHYNEEWKDARRILIETAKEGDEATTIALMKKINEKLGEEGIKPVELPPKYKKNKETSK